ncbi:MAG: hypothetical protein QOG89_1029 [Thermomicrobiales bacterium]|nr:hypothetical protein [Thermomicrobiales bacterium]
MAKTTPWEYATVTQEGDQDMVQIDYAGPHRVAHEDVPKGALGFTMGALGSKGWELVSVTASWRADSVYVTRLYFKRPHDEDRDLKS